MKTNTKKLLKFAYYVQNKYFLNIKIATNQDYQDKYRKKIDEIQDEDLPRKEKNVKIQEAIKIIQKEMLLDEQFEKIFKTSNGSIYFLDKNKECLRIKRNEKGELEFQPITKDLFFINKNDLKPLMNSLRALPYIEMEILSGRAEDRPSISLAEYEIGSIPIEINVKSLCDKYKRNRLIEYKKEDGKLIFNATKINEEKEPSDIIDFFGDLFGGFHYGHEITEIIK
jgi:hypothetical protein